MEALKVGATTNSGKLAGAITNIVRTEGTAMLQAIGAAAVGQSVKAVAIARGYLAPQGIEICMIPGFRDIDMEGAVKTMMILEVRQL